MNKIILISFCLYAVIGLGECPPPIPGGGAGGSCPPPLPDGTNPPNNNAQNWLNTNQPGAVCMGNSLATNVPMTANKALCSPDGNWVAVYQTNDGNLVVYDTRTSASTWSLVTMGVGAAAMLATGKVLIQNDCNLVVYAGTPQAPIWSSGTNTWGNACVLNMQNDGNLVIYKFYGEGDQSALWSILSPGYTISQTTLSYAIPDATNPNGGFPRCLPEYGPNNTIVGYYLLANGFYNCPEGIDNRGGISIHADDPIGMRSVSIGLRRPTTNSGTWKVEHDDNFFLLDEATYDITGDIFCKGDIPFEQARWHRLIPQKVTCAPPIIQ